MTYLIYSVYLGTADDLPEGGKKLLSLSPLPAAKNPRPLGTFETNYKMAASDGDLTFDLDDLE